MPITGETESTHLTGNAQIREDGYLFINDKINFFTGEMEVAGRKQCFILGVPVEYEVDGHGRRYALAVNRPDSREIVKFLFDISDTTAIEMCIDGNDNDERYATYFYYDAKGICQHGVFSDLSGYNILVESDYDSKGRIVRYYEHTGNRLTQITYGQDAVHVQCGHSTMASDMLIKDIYCYPDGTIKGFVKLPNGEVAVDNLRYIGSRKHKIIPGSNYDSLVWDIINFDIADWQ
jgi:hypothetical protein